jgi:putative DNA primase/helicase
MDRRTKSVIRWNGRNSSIISRAREGKNSYISPWNQTGQTKDKKAKRHHRRNAHAAASTSDPSVELSRLQSLSPLEYEVQRQAAAKMLGIRVSTLDTLVKKGNNGEAPDQGRIVIVTDVEPWLEPVEGHALLDAISRALRDHLVITAEQADTTALWSIYTHAFEAFRIAPRLGFQAPGMGCGKTEAIRRVKRLVARPVSGENFTAAVLFRLTDSKKPTLLLDELDNLLTEEKSAGLGLMNSGYERDGCAFRCVGDQNELRAFSTFSPMAYAMIGSPPGTFDSRTITIEMRRATPAEASGLISLEDGQSEDTRFRNLGRMAARWAKDNVQKLAAARPDMAGLVNRQADNWRPLFAIADVVGGQWALRARTAAKVLTAKPEASSVFVETLVAIQKIFCGCDEISSQEIVNALIAIEGGPWAEWGKANKPITANALARLRKPHKVFPSDIGPEHRRRKGYRRSQFKHLFEAYLKEGVSPGGDMRAAAHYPGESASRDRCEARSQARNCADKKSQKPKNASNLRGCAASGMGSGDRAHKSADNTKEAA